MLSERIEFAPERDAEIFAAVPAGPAVFLLRGDESHAEPYVSKTANLRRRLQRLLGPVLLVVLWQLLSSSGVFDERTVPAPTTVAAAAWRLIVV